MVANVCPKCESTDIDTDGARGEAVCTNCGHVLEECVIVSEVQFSENAGGQSSVVGQFVPESGTSFRSGPGYGGFGKDSREVTLANGRRIIQHIAGLLRLVNHHVDVAQRFFQQAVQRNFIQGRRTHTVVAVCLYIVCRKSRTSHMLIDFAEVLQTDVYELGSVFLKFCKLLNINLDPIDPSLYIHRFASLLEFSEKTQQVASTALRIVARMNREWMTTGRRPAGICGAGLMIAAKMHNFNRTECQIAQVVRICDGTLRKRINEFDETEASNMTVDEFNALFKAGSNNDFVDQETARREQERWLWTSACAPPIMKLRQKQARKSKEATPDDTSGTPSSDVQVNMDDVEEQMRQAMDSDVIKQLDQDARYESTLKQAAEKQKQGAQPSLKSGSHPQATGPAGLRLAKGKPSMPAAGTQRKRTARSEDENYQSQEDEENLSDVSMDDDEIDSYIRTSEEAEAREVVWNELNRDYLANQAERQRLAEVRGTTVGPEKVKRRRKTNDGQGASTAAEATATMLRSKNLSNKVNYSRLQALLQETV